MNLNFNSNFNIIYFFNINNYKSLLVIIIINLNSIIFIIIIIIHFINLFIFLNKLHYMLFINFKIYFSLILTF